MDRFKVAMVRAASVVTMLAFGAGCGGGASSDGGSPESTSSGDMTASEASMAGVYSATYSGSYTATSSLGSQSGTNTATATITVTELGGGKLQAFWQVGSNPPNGTIDFAMSGEDGTAVGVPVGGLCFEGLLDNGNTQTNCCTSCSIAFSGSMFSQPNSGTMLGVTAAGASYTGTYDGQWVAQKQ
jgi:hypothetical protein